MYFTVVLNISAETSPRDKDRDRTRQLNLFFDTFRKRAGKKIEEDNNRMNEKLRRELSSLLKEAMIEKLQILFNLNEETYSGPPDPTHERNLEIQKALNALDFNVLEIRGGSLEILLFVLGAAKLLSLTGITPNDFATCLQIVAPAAINQVFGTDVPLSPSAKPTPEGQTGDPNSATTDAPQLLAARRDWSAAAYLIPAVFAGAVFYFALQAYQAVSDRLVSVSDRLVNYANKQSEQTQTERKELVEKLSALLSAHETALGAEQSSFLEKSGSLLGSIVKSDIDRDVVLAGEQKTLFDAQSNLIAALSLGNQARDAAVTEYVKDRLTSEESKKTPSAPPTVIIKYVRSSGGKKKPVRHSNNYGGKNQ